MTNVMFTIEARTLNSKDNIFLKDNLQDNQNVFLTTSLAISFWFFSQIENSKSKLNNEKENNVKSYKGTLYSEMPQISL